MKLSIKEPEHFAGDWEPISKKLIHYLIADFDLCDNDEPCNWELFSFLSEEQCKDLSVMVFGNDFPSTVELVKSLRIIGDGQCPNCGSNDCEYIPSYPDSEFEYEETSTFTSGGYTTCNVCNFKF